MPFSFIRRIRAGYLTAFILLLFSYSLTFYTTWQLSNQNKTLNHTNDVINKLELLNSNIKDVTIGVRGYIIMRDAKFLLPYYSARKNIDSVYKILLQLTKNNSLQHERLLTLDSLIKRKFDIAESSLKIIQSAALVPDSSIEELTLVSKKNSDSVRLVIGLMQNRENDLQKKRSEAVSFTSVAIKVVNLTSLIVAILLVIYSVFTFNIQNRAKRDADNRAAGYRKQLEERVMELDKANKDLEELRRLEKFAITGRIARAIAHEVRNPLTNIGLAAEQIKIQSPDNPDNDDLLQMINRNTGRINQLVTDLLNSSKFSELNYETASINNVLDDALALAFDRIQLRKIAVKKKYAAKLRKVSVDVEKIRIAFLNIMVNAVEAMDDDRGVLLLETIESDNKCVVAITDNGIGMDRETISKLFEPYFTNKIKGNGLGLTNTQNIILNHKGYIEVKSELGK
ncbi:MAG TPA: CHASE3 domain-containing protein, partial [Puia sp.]|nr:CHASE3 domain-containing protein [Puia sp.]